MKPNKWKCERCEQLLPRDMVTVLDHPGSNKYICHECMDDLR